MRVPDPAALPPAVLHPQVTAALDATHWDKLTWLGRRSYPIRCNWKVFVDNCLDGGYRIPNMHPSLDAQLDMPGHGTTCFEHTEDDEAQAFIARSMAQTHRTQVEDVAVSESVQTGLTSPSYHTGRYAPGIEQGIHHFHRLLAADLRRGLGIA